MEGVHSIDLYNFFNFNKYCHYAIIIMGLLYRYLDIEMNIQAKMVGGEGIMREVDSRL